MHTLACGRGECRSKVSGERPLARISSITGEWRQRRRVRESGRGRRPGRRRRGWLRPNRRPLAARNHAPIIVRTQPRGGPPRGRASGPIHDDSARRKRSKRTQTAETTPNARQRRASDPTSGAPHGQARRTTLSLQDTPRRLANLSDARQLRKYSPDGLPNQAGCMSPRTAMCILRGR